MKKFLILASFLAIAGNSYAIQGHSYKALSRTFIGDESILSGSNFIKDTLQSPTGLVELNGMEFKTAAKDSLDTIKEDTYLQDLIISKNLQQALQEYVKQYGCKEYRFRHGLAAADKCGEGNKDSKKVEKVLFGENNLVVNYPNLNEKVNRDNTAVFFTLSSPKTTDEASIWFGAHAIKGLMSKNIKSGETLLTIYLDVYKVEDGYRGEKLVKETMATFVVVPSWSDIANQKDEKAAGEFTASNARMLRIQN